MAGRPAARGGGLTRLHYGLITFVIISVAALIGFVIVLTQVKDAETRAANVERQIRQFGSPPSYYADEATARGSQTFAVMAEDVQRIAKLISGNSEAVGKTLETDAAAALGALAQKHSGAVSGSDTLLGALGRLDQALSDQKAKSTALSDELAEAQKENQTLSAAIKGAKDDFSAQVTALGERVAQIQLDRDTALGDKDRQLTDLAGNLEGATQEANRLKQENIKDSRDRELAIARLQNQIETLQGELRGLKQTFDPNAILTKSDGKIVRAIPGSDVVYINLGANDKLKVGMGFAVFSQTREAPRDLRGKASLEVVSLMDDSAECRVARTSPGEPIIEGDFIVNITYERSRKPKFVVVGDYDLNYDGNIDFDGAERVKSMIRQWGGQVVDNLDETTDFVIIGRAPDVPQLVSGEPISAVVKALADDKSRELSKFRDLITQALSMYIPVINQNQFLYLTGYAGDSVIARR